MKQKKDNKVKRKRGKKFVFLSQDQKEAQDLEKKNQQTMQNPFELHSKTKRINKDAEIRTQLIDEFKNRSRNSSFIDKRIGERSNQLSNDDKMRLRFMKEQADQLRRQKLADANDDSKVKGFQMTRKRKKFSLEEDSEDENLNFLTHKGKKIDFSQMDDFKDKIAQSSESEDEYGNKRKSKGHLSEEMVKALNFGRGNEDDQDEPQEKKKTREERLKEIMEKSKAYKFYASELKLANQEATRQLDDDWGEVAQLLNFKQPTFQEQKQNQKPIEQTKQEIVFDDILAQLKSSGSTKVEPAKKELSFEDKALQKRKELESLQQEYLETKEELKKKRLPKAK